MYAFPLSQILSIPFWSDFIKRTLYSEHTIQCLSIPFWSDFITLKVQEYAIKQDFFQSHFGLILSLDWGWGIRMRHLLSIPFWSDFIARRENSTNYYKRLSIPFWSDFISNTEAMSRIVSFSSFNPILVWFYHQKRSYARSRGDILSIPFWSDFIKNERSDVLLPHPTFNPILVWFYLYEFLKSMYDYDILSIPFWSDFILAASTLTDYWEGLSIPFWSDFIWYAMASNPNPCIHFQSHFGLILSDLFRGSIIHIRSWLSIPFWSDFIREFKRTVDRILITFNPILVWFYLLSFSTTSTACLSFQSHFGLILSIYTKHTNRKHKNLSIPFWSDFISFIGKSCKFASLSFQSHFGLILSSNG